MIKKWLIAIFFSIIVLYVVYDFLIAPKLTQVISEESGEVRREFYIDGSVKSEVPLKGGLPHGKEKVYFKNGHLFQENVWVNGVKYRHSYEYYNSYDTFNIVTEKDTILTARSKLKSYKYINELNQINYSVSFDKENRVQKTFGKTMPEYWFDKKQYSRGDTLNAMFILPQPFYVDYGFFIGEDVSDNQITDWDKLNVDYENGVVRYKKVFSSAGKHRFGIVSNLVYDDGYVDSDTIYLDVDVN